MDPTKPGQAASSAMVDNENYEEQMRLYRESLNNGPQSSLSATMDADMLAKWNAHRQKYNPTERGLTSYKTVYDPNSVDPITGLPSQFLSYYNKPSRQLEASRPTPTPAPREPRYLHPHTGEPLDPEVYGTPAEGTDVQFTQGLELTSRKLENLQKRKNTQDQISRNKALLEKMTPEQKQEARAKGMTPMQYLESQGISTLQQGGLLYKI